MSGLRPKAATDRLTVPQLIRQFIEGITNTDKGFIYTLIGLVQRPGVFLRNYIEGKRYNVYNPFQFVFLTVVVLIVIDHWIGIRFDKGDIVEKVQDYEGFQFGAKIGRFTTEHNKWFTLLIVPLAGFARSLFYKKFNLAEHVVIACYVLGITFLIQAMFCWIIPPSFIFNPFLYLISSYFFFRVYHPYRPTFEVVLVEIVSALITFILVFFFMILIVLMLAQIFPDILAPVEF